MSFLNELKKQKNKLKVIETVVTNADGQRFIESGGEKIPINPNTYGFVVDTKPDNVPVEVVKHLYIGSQDCAAADLLTEHKIKNVLSLGVDATVENVQHKFLQCLDLPETNIKAVLAESLPFLRRAIEHEENVLVHCNAGVSRTAMVAIAYLMQYDRMSFDDAYAFVKEKRPAIQPNTGFRNQLKRLQPGEVI